MFRSIQSTPKFGYAFRIKANALTPKHSNPEAAVSQAIADQLGRYLIDNQVAVLVERIRKKSNLDGCVVTPEKGSLKIYSQADLVNRSKDEVNIEIVPMVKVGFLREDTLEVVRETAARITETVLPRLGFKPTPDFRAQLASPVIDQKKINDLPVYTPIAVAPKVSYQPEKSPPITSEPKALLQRKYSYFYHA